MPYTNEMQRQGAELRVEQQLITENSS